MIVRNFVARTVTSTCADWCFQFADVKPVEFEIDPFLYRERSALPSPWAQIPSRCPPTRYVYFLGNAQPAKRNHTDHQKTWHKTQRKSC